MKATGIVRRVDELGRLVIPKELRRELGINEGDPLEIYRDADLIILKAYRPGCQFCGNTADDLTSLHNKLVCGDCRTALAKV